MNSLIEVVSDSSNIIRTSPLLRKKFIIDNVNYIRVASQATDFERLTVSLLADILKRRTDTDSLYRISTSFVYIL
jgi:hypothetical protein